MRDRRVVARDHALLGLPIHQVALDALSEGTIRRAWLLTDSSARGTRIAVWIWLRLGLLLVVAELAAALRQEPRVRLILLQCLTSEEGIVSSLNGARLS